LITRGGINPSGRKKYRKTWAILAKLQKKVVIGNGFWKINAIQPEIKARRGRMKKFELGQKANWRRLVKELGCQIVTRSYSANCYILHSDEC